MKNKLYFGDNVIGIFPNEDELINYIIENKIAFNLIRIDNKKYILQFCNCRYYVTEVDNNGIELRKTIIKNL